MDSSFAERLIAWQKEYGRNNLPWQQSHDPYVRWLAEIMLQQTQVKTVIPYFNRFMERFPTVQDLAEAPEEEVMKLWAGLGYYTRARNLHKCAKEVHRRFGGRFPIELQDLESLPGIGTSTAAAIRSAATDEPCAILDGNVKRVLARHGMIGKDLTPRETEKRLWEDARAKTPQKEGRTYAQAVMDLGATVCTRTKPLCSLCPVNQDCKAFLADCQLEYPIKKVRAPVPEEMLNLAVYTDGKVVYLVRKTERYWKGLWTLPQLQDEEAEQSEDVLPVVEHQLTHLLLKIYPVRLSMPEAVPAEWRAFTKEQIETEALPTPIRKLLLEIL